jgi:calcineurin-like phosphoesterase family protein
MTFRDIWIVSDTHFNHKNILNFQSRETGKLIRPGFHTLEDMNEHIIDRWNSVVKKGDLVYHLGDVFFGPQENYLPIHKRLRGSKRLILGNHDNVRFFAQYELFGKIQIWEPLQKYGILLSHIPLEQNQLKERFIKRTRTHPREAVSRRTVPLCLCRADKLYSS